MQNLDYNSKDTILIHQYTTLKKETFDYGKNLLGILAQMDDSATLHLVGLRELVARACAETVVVRHGLLICSSLVTLRAAEGHASVRFRKIVRSSKYNRCVQNGS